MQEEEVPFELPEHAQRKYKRPITPENDQLNIKLMPSDEGVEYRKAKLTNERCGSAQATRERDEFRVKSPNDESASNAESNTVAKKKEQLASKIGKFSKSVSRKPYKKGEEVNRDISEVVNPP